MGSNPAARTTFLAYSSMAEHRTVNARVVGSSPTLPANLNRSLVVCKTGVGVIMIFILCFSTGNRARNNRVLFSSGLVA